MSTNEAKALAARRDADIYFLSGPINQEASERFYDVARRPSERLSNAVLILASSSGELEACYRIARLLRRNYKDITLMLIGRCGGIAGFMALACDAIAMSDFGEFSPLDITKISQNEQLLQAYASRLNPGYEDILSTLASTYPTADFIIDLQEAADIFGIVRTLEDDEYAVADALIKQYPETRYLDQQESHIECLSVGAVAKPVSTTTITTAVSAPVPKPEVTTGSSALEDKAEDSSANETEDPVTGLSIADVSDEDTSDNEASSALRGSKDARREMESTFGKKDESRRRSRDNK